jgi:rare lipoprotein A
MVPAVVLFIILMVAPAITHHIHSKSVICGMASWYGARESGKKMANGQVFDPKRYTCASLTYTFGTRLRVSYPTTGKSVIVTVTDRGPFINGRIIDLSEAAARHIGLVPYGIGRVLITPLKGTK